MQGIGDSSQGFANAILFIIFTKNIRESFIDWIHCKKGQDNEDLENREQTQTPSSSTAHLNHVSGGIQINKKGTVESDSEVTEQKEEEEVPLVIGTPLSSQSNKQEQSDHFRRYGAIS